MKLNAIQIDRYGIFNSFRMPELAPGFNLIYGGNGTGKSTLARYVRNVLYGFATEDLSDGGYVDVVVSHQVSRLVRDLRSGNRLVCKPVVSTGISQNVDPSPSILDAVGETAFDTVFHVRVRDASRSASNVANLLMTRFGVPAGKSVFGNEVEYATFSRRESELRDCINRYQERLGELKLNRDCLVREIDRIESESHIHVNALDEEIKQIESALKRINLVGLREQIAVLDSEISATRIRVEQNQERVDYVSRPFAQSDSVAMLYRRLDEVDLQIRQWRSVHADVQQQRVQLKDEMTVWNSMTVESNEHPYHRSRETEPFSFFSPFKLALHTTCI